MRDTLIVFRGELELALRHRRGLLIGLVQPAVYLVLFGPLLAHALPPGTNAWSFLVPGLLIQLGLFGAGFAGFNLIPDLRSGFIERLRVTPVSRRAILLGRALKDAVVLALQIAPLLVAGAALGMAADPLGVLAAVLLLLLTGVSLASLSYRLALALPNEYLFAPVVNSLAVPLMLLSGILLPLTAAPAWLDLASRLNPLRAILDALRALFAGTVDATVYAGFGTAAALALVSFAALSMQARRM
jgi:ABC-2 type transport system permease protein